MGQKVSVSLSTEEVRRLRRLRGENQEVFWKSIGVSQSSGSHYETKRRINRPVSILLDLKQRGIDIYELNRQDFLLIQKLKEEQPSLYRKLCRRVETRRKGMNQHDEESFAGEDYSFTRIDLATGRPISPPPSVLGQGVQGLEKPKQSGKEPPDGRE